jgi:hypothetical protein
MDDAEGQLPSQLLIDLALEPLNGRGIYYYIRQRGDRKTGVILMKLNRLDGFCRLLIQQRNDEGKMAWMDALKTDLVEEPKAEAYIQRSILRDPDLWVIEIEDREMANPFAQSVI